MNTFVVVICQFGRTSKVFFSFLFGRYLGSIIEGKVSLSLNLYFGEQTFLRVSSIVNIENRDCAQFVLEIN